MVVWFGFKKRHRKVFQFILDGMTMLFGFGFSYKLVSWSDSAFLAGDRSFGWVSIGLMQNRPRNSRLRLGQNEDDSFKFKLLLSCENDCDGRVRYCPHPSPSPETVAQAGSNTCENESGVLSLSSAQGNYYDGDTT
jgi:hypothetical protein